MVKKEIETIGSSYDRKNNFFDFLRFVLASMVIYFHSFPLFFGLGKVPDPFTKLVQGQIVLGELAVDGFLVISGFLITQSLLNGSGFISYMVKRFLRIFPAFISSTLLMALIVGPMITKLSVNEYFSRGINSVYRFVFDSLTFNLNGYHTVIRDLFLSNPLPFAVNGSAWTLKHEFAMYLILPFLLLSSNILKRFEKIDFKKLAILIGIFFLTLTVLYYSYNIRIESIYGNKYFWVMGNEYDQFVKLGFYFFSGVIFYVYKEKIICNLSTIILAFLGVLLANYFHVLFYGILLFLPYIIISLGVKLRFSKFKKYGDFSYGLYIYAFPVQQTIIFLFLDKISHSQFTVLSFIITLIIAVLSWKLVEEPCLKQKNRIAELLQNKFEVGIANKKVSSGATANSEKSP